MPRNVIAVSTCSAALPLTKNRRRSSPSRARILRSTSAIRERVLQRQQPRDGPLPNVVRARMRGRSRAPTERAWPAGRPLSSAWPLTPASTRSKMRGTAVITDGRTSRMSRSSSAGSRQMK